ncbi:MAG: cob(I)yrinic acid a,c-diamide adenosyltransferase [Gammaproteobacteria bacterium]|nr:cob(I)yrinic acid a,c-diamide adenosyltransferase [Gammaproteobacteria bacterium]
MANNRPRIDRVTTTSGDGGETSLADGKRHSKGSPRMELVGALDELNCDLGLAALTLEGALLEQVRSLQARVFDIGAAVATGKPQPFWLRETERLADATETINSKLEALAEFVLPGGNEANARLHIARAMARRCERVFWRLDDSTLIKASIGTFLNRLSDFLFVASRSVCEDEVLWQPLKD